MRLYQFSDLIGNSNVISLLQRTVTNKNSDRFIIIAGVLGSGKSTSADIIGLYKTCESPKVGEPCLQCSTCKRNMEALETTGVSNNLVKKNIGLVKTDSDMKKLIDEIFTLLQGSVGENVYILEEAHEFSSSNQNALLAEFDRLGENTTVIMTTTDVNMLIPTLRSRALTFTFSRLTDGEAKLLLDRTVKKLGMRSVDSESASLILKYAKGIPRDIVKMVKFVMTSGATKEELIEFMGYVGNEAFLDLFSNMKLSMRDYMISLKNLMNGRTTHDIVSQLKEFIENALFYIETRELDSFTKEEAATLLSVLTEDTAYQCARMLRSVPSKGLEEEDFKLFMIDLRQRVNNRTVKEIFTENNKRASEQKVETSERYRQETEFRRVVETKEDKKLTPEFLRNLNKDWK